MIGVLMRITLAAAATASSIVPAHAQISVIAPPQRPLAAYSGSIYQFYPFTAPTPDDAYRDGLINRWELEQLTGPLPQALQGPSVNGSRGGDGGGNRN